MSSPFWQEKFPFYWRLFLTATKKIGVIAGVMVLFIFSLELTKASVANNIDSSIFHYANDFLQVPTKAFWAAYLSGILTMSGSSVAALGVSLAAIDLIPSSNLVIILLGSRASPNIVLLFVGFLATFKGKSLYRSIGLGVLEYVVTLTIVLGAIFFSSVPYFISLSAYLAQFMPQVQISESLLSLLLEPLISLIITFSGETVSFILGLVILIAAIKLFDKFFSFLNFDEKDDTPIRRSLRASLLYFVKHPIKRTVKFFEELPDLIRSFFHPSFREQFRKNLQHWIANPSISFMLGLLITALTMSNAVSVTLLLPFYIYKVVDIRAVVPYIIGANISTFLDTLFIAVMTGSPISVQSIMGALSATLFTVIIIAILYKPYLFLLTLLTHYLFKHRLLLVPFFLLAFGLPLLFLYL